VDYNQVALDLERSRLERAVSAEASWMGEVCPDLVIVILGVGDALFMYPATPSV
jgi:hypothetical protein